MNYYFIIHDNGILGQKGFTDYTSAEVENAGGIEKLVESYKADGIVVYGVDKTNDLSVKYEGNVYVLTQDAYLEHNPYSNRTFYTALAVREDEYGPDFNDPAYVVEWDIINPDTEDEGNACDWDTPCSVKHVGTYEEV